MVDVGNVGSQRRNGRERPTRLVATSQGLSCGGSESEHGASERSSLCHGVPLVSVGRLLLFVIASWFLLLLQRKTELECFMMYGNCSLPVKVPRNVLGV